MYAGVDWAGKSWFGVFIDDDGGSEMDVYPTLWNLWGDRNEDISRMLVDIPIGLCSASMRACDVEAKKYVGSQQQGSVFYTPTRDAVYAKNIEQGKQEQESQNAGFGIQSQAWSLVPRIREVDAFLRGCKESEAVLETHPEACFAALNGGPLDNSKKNEEGKMERLALLEEAVELDVEKFYTDAIEDFRKPQYAPMIGSEDDILDALVAAVTARASEPPYHSLPDDSQPDFDSELGRDIEILLPSP